MEKPGHDRDRVSWQHHYELLAGDKVHAVWTDHAGDYGGQYSGIEIQFPNESAAVAGGVAGAGLQKRLGDGIDGLAITIGDQQSAGGSVGEDRVIDRRRLAVGGQQHAIDILIGAAGTAYDHEFAVRLAIENDIAAGV